ncbi:MAG: hypothetical protein KO217_06380 [Methanobacteriaceae archaeon]|nr:hypothetical protein [Methanobacteriaceae archaeon]
MEVENINGLLLLISSGDDRVWPLKKMSEMIIERLNSHNFKFKVKHLSYECAGHLAGRPGYMSWPVLFYVRA